MVEKENNAEQDEASEDGASMPGVVGAVTAVANSAPGKALFGPAATVLGAYWGERMDELVARWRRQRTKNVEEHTRRVQAVEGESLRDIPTEKQTEQLHEWLKHAETIDPKDDPELAA